MSVFATIDIGTNSLLLLVGEPLAHGKIRVVEDRAAVTRLGEGFASSGIISDMAAERTLQELAACHGLCVKHGTTGIVVVGTAILREAANAADFLLVAKHTLGLDIEVLSARREAELSYNACAHDFGADIAVLDIGGGSTEFVARSKEGLELASLPAGCVVFTERFLKSDPVRDDEIHDMRMEVRAALSQGIDPSKFSRPHDRTLVAVAGTATTLAAMHMKLARYDGGRVHGSKLKIDGLRDIIDELKKLSIAERKELPGLIPERADVILAGAEILHEAMGFMGYAEATISDRGVKWGLFYEKFCRT